jgi:hypothetical protein
VNIDLGFTNETEISELVPQFPAIFARAQSDWAKYKKGLELVGVDPDKRGDIEEWFAEFPKLWAAVRPNWVEPLPGGTLSSHKVAFAGKVDRWVGSLRAEPVLINHGLGIVSLVIAGILIAGALGVGGAIWAVGYVKKQNNVSRLIDEVTAGRIPPSVLEQAVQEERGGLFSDLASLPGSLLGIGAVVVAGYFLLPRLLKGRA